MGGAVNNDLWHNVAPFLIIFISTNTFYVVSSYVKVAFRSPPSLLLEVGYQFVI